MDNFLGAGAATVTADSEKEARFKRRRRIVITTCACGAFGMGALLWPFVSPGLRKIALPYLPATDTQTTIVRSVLSGRTGSMIDLGSGDGRLVYAAAEEGLRATGVELNPWLVWWSRYTAFRRNLHSNTKFYRKDIFKVDLSKFDNIVLFGVPGMMPKLEEKLAEEMMDSSLFIACRFPLPHCQPCQVLGSGVDTVWLYRKSDILARKAPVNQEPHYNQLPD